ncbi:hypothetical protein A4X13_0g9525, partial [Tilletia indica]
AIIRPFNQAVRDVKEKGVTEEDDWATDKEVREDFDADEIEEEGGEEDRAFSANLHPSDAYDEQDDQLVRRAPRDKGVTYVGNEDEPESPSSSTSSAPPVPTAELRADSGAVGLQIRQLAWFARKLRYNTPLRVSFRTTCALFKLSTPHSLIRDVATRWNSTFGMIERGLVLWDAIVTRQKKKKHNVKLISAKFVMTPSETPRPRPFRLNSPLAPSSAPTSGLRPNHHCHAQHYHLPQRTMPRPSASSSQPSTLLSCPFLVFIHQIFPNILFPFSAAWVFELS